MNGDSSAQQRGEDLDVQRIVARVQAGGDREEFGKVYQRYFDRVFARVRPALGSREDAEDLTQQVFLKALESLDRYDPKRASFKTWLYGIAGNALADLLRRNAHVELEALEAADEEVGATEAASVDLSRSWLKDPDVAVFVDRLPEAQRLVLGLRFALDMPVEEIAAAIGKTPKAVRMLEERARKTLKARLVAVGHPAAKRLKDPMFRRSRPNYVMAARRFSLNRRLPNNTRTPGIDAVKSPSWLR